MENRDQPQKPPVDGQRHVYQNQSGQWIGCLYCSFKGTWGFRLLPEVAPTATRHEAFRALDAQLRAQALRASGVSILDGEYLREYRRRLKRVA